MLWRCCARPQRERRGGGAGVIIIPLRHSSEMAKGAINAKFEADVLTVFFTFQVVQACRVHAAGRPAVACGAAAATARQLCMPRLSAPDRFHPSTTAASSSMCCPCEICM